MAPKAKLPSEHVAQVVVVSWYKLQYPKFKQCVISIPNGMHIAGTKIARAIKMRKLKAEGFKNGASDLLFAVPVGGKHGLWLEMKAQKKTAKDVTDDQMDHIILMREMGYAADWAAGADEAIRIIKNYMNGTTEL